MITINNLNPKDSIRKPHELYSQIIDAADYDRIISKEHLYISASDNYLVDLIEELKNTTSSQEVIELGCGTGRLLKLTSKVKNINLTGIDKDINFLNYARNILKDLPINIIETDILSYQHPHEVAIFYSQGVHHHIAKGQMTTNYLSHIYNQLVSGGYYLISDEFVPNYSDDNERDISLIIWYSHVIDHAIKDGFEYLAQEEAKTLLDDLHEGQEDVGFKTCAQIKIILEKVSSINLAAQANDLKLAKGLSSNLLQAIKINQSAQISGDNTIDLSRKDYKICDAVFRKEVEEAGFIIESNKSFGPIKNIGGMSIYALKKP